MNTPGAGTIAELKAALAAAGRREVLLATSQNDDSTALVCASKHGHTATALKLKRPSAPSFEGPQEDFMRRDGEARG